VVLLVWVYFTAQIFLLGAEFTWVYSHEHGSNAAHGVKQSAVVVPCRSGGEAAAIDAKNGPQPDAT
jgi:membrane protein